jgi:eukaryotic-like serine/threonine-protein kinase
MTVRPPYSRCARSLRVWPLVSLVLLLSLAPSGCGSGCTTSSFCPGDWPQFRFNPAHIGLNPYETKISPANVGQLTTYWSHSIGKNKVSSSPAVVHGVVYIGSGENYVYALDAASGAVKWKRTVGGVGFSANSSPAVVSGVVYLGVHGFNQSYVYALDAAKGNLDWVTPIGNVFAYTSPAVDAGLRMVYMNSGYTLYGLSVSGGTVKWSTPIGVSDASPAEVEGVVYLGVFVGDPQTLQGPGVYALSAATGAVKWATPLPNAKGVTYSSPTVANGLVYVGADDGFVYALTAATGVLKWHTLVTAANPQFATPVTSSPAVANNLVYVNTGLSVVALDANNGGIKWITPLPANAGDSSPAVANGVVYVGSNDEHHVYALAANGAGVLWTHAIAPPGGVNSSDPACSPAVANGVVYIGSIDGHVVAFH